MTVSLYILIYSWLVKNIQQVAQHSPWPARWCWPSTVELGQLEGGGTGEAEQLIQDEKGLKLLLELSQNYIHPFPKLLNTLEESSHTKPSY